MREQKNDPYIGRVICVREKPVHYYRARGFALILRKNKRFSHMYDIVWLGKEMIIDYYFARSNFQRDFDFISPFQHGNQKENRN